MEKRCYITNITALPSSVSRETAVSILHDHVEMIQLNPLVIRHGTTTAPPHAPKDELESMIWYELTDLIQYVPGTPLKGEITYKGGFYDLPRGLQTHVYAPMGVELLGKWHIGGTLPGEAKEPVELGFNGPKEGLYLREDVSLKCNFMLSSFVKSNLKKSHAVLVAKLIEKAQAGGEKTSLGSAQNGAMGQNVNSSAVTPSPLGETRPEDRSRDPRRDSDPHGVDTARGNTHRRDNEQLCSCTGPLHERECDNYPELRPTYMWERQSNDDGYQNYMKHQSAATASKPFPPNPPSQPRAGRASHPGRSPQDLGGHAELDGTSAPLSSGERPVELEGETVQPHVRGGDSRAPRPD